MIPDQSNKDDQKKSRISFEQFRMSMSSMLASSDNSVKTEFANDSFKSGKYSPARFSTSTTFSGTPIISDASHGSSMLHTSGDSFLGR